jgi:hypothetical protein
MAEERYVVVPDLAFVVREQPSADCLSTQHAEERRRHLKRPDVFGAGTRAHLESLEPIERLRFEHLGERETIEIVRHRGSSPFHASAGERAKTSRSAAGRGAAATTGLHDREDGGVRADAQTSVEWLSPRSSIRRADAARTSGEECMERDIQVLWFKVLGF